MSRLSELQDFLYRHRVCGTLTSAMPVFRRDGYQICITCSCGETFERWAGNETTEFDPGLSFDVVSPSPAPA